MLPTGLTNGHLTNLWELIQRVSGDKSTSHNFVEDTGGDIRQIVSCGEKPAKLYYPKSLEELFNRMQNILDDQHHLDKELLQGVYAPEAGDWLANEPTTQLAKFMKIMEALPAEQQKKFGVEVIYKAPHKDGLIWDYRLTIGDTVVYDSRNKQNQNQIQNSYEYTGHEFLCFALTLWLEKSKDAITDVNKDDYPIDRGTVSPGEKGKGKQKKEPSEEDLRTTKNELTQWLSEDSQKKAIKEIWQQAKEAVRPKAVTGLLEQFTELIVSAPASIRNKFNVTRNEGANGKVFVFEIKGVKICECPAIESTENSLCLLAVEGSQNAGLARKCEAAKTS